MQGLMNEWEEKDFGNCRNPFVSCNHFLFQFALNLIQF